MLLLLPDIPKVELLGAIIAYRIVYYLLPLALAMVLLAIHELSVHRIRLSVTTKNTSDWMSGIAPQAIGLVVFIAGVILLVSGSLPGDASRLRYVTDFLALSFLETSHMLNSAIGVGLLIVARGLHQRLRGAYQLFLLLLLSGMVVSLGKGLDFEEAGALMLAAALL